MPLNNSINKNSDTFFATSNITANFTSPITSVTISGSAITARITSVSNVSLTANMLIQNAGDGSLSNKIHITRSRGTVASPTNLDGSTYFIGAVSFSSYISGAFTRQAELWSYSSSTRKTIGITNYTGTFGVRLGLTNTSTRAAGAITAIDLPCIMSNATNLWNGADYLVDTTLIAGELPLVWVGTQDYPQPAYAGIRTNHLGFAVDWTTALTNPPAITLGRINNSYPNYTNTVLDQQLGAINFAGCTQTRRLNTMAQILGVCDGTVGGTTDSPGRLQFMTVPDGTATPTEAMRLDNAGRVTQIRQPSFSASLSADVANATGDGTAYTIAFNTEQYDQGSNFAANTFTAPIAGKYRFNWTISVDDLLVGHTKMEVTVGGQTVCRVNPYAIADSDGFCLLNGSVDLSLAASATVTMVVTISGSTKTVTVKGTTTSGTFLSGQLQV